jgi:hypothetical protein
MFVRSLVTLATLSIATAALAHDPAMHDLQMPKPVPTTCEQYADRETYSNDLTDPDIKALKDKCDAGKPADDEAEAKDVKDEEQGD